MKILFKKFGCDFSDQLIKICNEKNFNCFVSDCLKIPCRNEFFDYVICIAVLHHLSTLVSLKHNFSRFKKKTKFRFYSRKDV